MECVSAAQPLPTISNKKLWSGISKGNKFSESHYLLLIIKHQMAHQKFFVQIFETGHQSQNDIKPHNAVLQFFCFHVAIVVLRENNKTPAGLYLYLVDWFCFQRNQEKYQRKNRRLQSTSGMYTLKKCQL